MKFKFLFSLFFFISFCLADYIKELDRIAGEIAKGIPEGRVVVVLNLLNQGDFRETKNSVDLAIKLSMKISEKSKNKFRVIDRKAGERLFYEEKKYTPREFTSEELKKIIENFGANVGVIGEYRLIGRNLYLENIRAVEIPSTEKTPNILKAVAKKTINLNREDSILLYSMESPLPGIPDSLTRNLLEVEGENRFVFADLIDKDGKVITSNSIKIGNYYKLRIHLEEDAYLYVFSYDEERNIPYLIYPLTYEENRYINKGYFEIPQGNYSILAKEPAGRNYIKIFATKRPISIRIPSSKDFVLSSSEISSFVRELRKLLKKEWSSFKIFIIIED